MSPACSVTGSPVGAAENALSGGVPTAVIVTSLVAVTFAVACPVLPTATLPTSTGLPFSAVVDGRPKERM